VADLLTKVCAQVEDLLQRVAELQEAVRRLRNIREAEKETDSWFQAQSAEDPQPMAKLPKTTPLAHTEGRGANNAEWKLSFPCLCITSLRLNSGGEDPEGDEETN